MSMTHQAVVTASNGEVKLIESFDQMNLREPLLRGIHGCGFERPSAIQQRVIMPCIMGMCLSVILLRVHRNQRSSRSQYYFSRQRRRRKNSRRRYFNLATGRCRLERVSSIDFNTYTRSR